MSRTNAASRVASRLLTVALGILAMPVSEWAAAGPPLPSWPQKFYVNAMEKDGFGLPVTAAGPIAVAVHAHGAPIVVVLTRPNGTVAQQVVGTGDLRMSYGVTPAEVAVSSLRTASRTAARVAWSGSLLGHFPQSNHGSMRHD